MRSNFFNELWNLPWKVICCIFPFVHSLLHHRVYIPHFYLDDEDKYIPNQSVLVTPTSFRVVTPKTKPRKGEERIDNVNLLVMTCHFCRHQEIMWLRDGKTLKDLPEIKVMLGKP